MEEKRRIIIFYISGLISIILVLFFMYAFNDTRYECVTKDDLKIDANEIKVQGEICFGKMSDGTFVEIKSYRERRRFDILTYMLISIILYILINYIFYRVILLF